MVLIPKRIIFSLLFLNLAERGYLTKISNKDNSPFIPSDRIKESIKQNNEPKTNEVLLSPNDNALYEDLRHWRNSVASEKKLPPYCIFNNGTLQLIAKVRPKEHKELAKIKGFGKIKLGEYGDDVINVVSSQKV